MIFARNFAGVFLSRIKIGIYMSAGGMRSSFWPAACVEQDNIVTGIQGDLIAVSAYSRTRKNEY